VRREDHPSVSAQLRRAGHPLSTRELVGHSRAAAGIDGVERFRPVPSGQTTPHDPTPRSEAVYYLRRHHAPRDVVERWVEANRHLLERTSRRDVRRAVAVYGTRFVTAWEAVADDAYDGRAL
jgi:hypothetical protein